MVYGAFGGWVRKIYVVVRCNISKPAHQRLPHYSKRETRIILKYLNKKMETAKRETTSNTPARCGPYWTKDQGCFNKWKETNRNFSDGGWDRHVNAPSDKKDVLEEGETKEDMKVGIEDRFCSSMVLEREQSVQNKNQSSKTGDDRIRSR